MDGIAAPSQTLSSAEQKAVFDLLSATLEELNNAEDHSSRDLCVAILEFKESVEKWT